jgi:phosphoserine phosphatase
MRPKIKIACFDCDSTLSAIEGIDELARLKNTDTFDAVERMTREAMDGGVRLDDIFAKRLDLIRPTAADLAAIGDLYLKNIEPDAAGTLAALRADGWQTVIISGGFEQAIRPLADALGVERVEAVRLELDAAGNYFGFDRRCPTARAGGKNAIISALREQSAPCTIVMVGDGASDLETAPDVDLFVGFGRYAERPRVRAGAGAYIHRLAELPAVLRGL